MLFVEMDLSGVKHVTTETPFPEMDAVPRVLSNRDGLVQLRQLLVEQLVVIEFVQEGKNVTTEILLRVTDATLLVGPSLDGLVLPLVVLVSSHPPTVEIVSSNLRRLVMMETPNHLMVALLPVPSSPVGDVPEVLPFVQVFVVTPSSSEEKVAMTEMWFPEMDVPPAVLLKPDGLAHPAGLVPLCAAMVVRWVLKDATTEI